jgi:hypothetical protein
VYGKCPFPCPLSLCYLLCGTNAGIRLLQSCNIKEGAVGISWLYAVIDMRHGILCPLCWDGRNCETRAGREKASKFSVQTRLTFFVLNVFVAMGIV